MPRRQVLVFGGPGPTPLEEQGGWPTLPRRLLRTIASYRNLWFAPRFYLVLAVGGALAGAGWQALFGWVWWLGPAAAVAGAWLVSTASTFVRPLADPRGMGEALLWEVSPDRARARSQRRMHRQLRAAPFPVYGLNASWAGPRWLGGGSSDHRGLHEVVLGHGDPRVAQVRVASSAVARDLDEVLWGPERIEQRPVVINGAAKPFAVVEDGDTTRATCEVDGRSVTVECTGVPLDQVRLVRVDDVEPYLP